MMKKITLFITVVCLVICCAFAVAPVITSSGRAVAVKEVLPAVKIVAPHDESSVNGARFLNMLNHSYVYGEDFGDIRRIVNNSAAALLDMADNEGYISDVYFAEYLRNMYGLSVDGLDGINSDLGYKKGFVYALFDRNTQFEHELLDVTENEDGSYAVLTSVNVRHDESEIESVNAVTLFVKNEESIFGYSIVSSDLISGLCKA